jgi:hypothetical protein
VMQAVKCRIYIYTPLSPSQHTYDFEVHVSAFAHPHFLFSLCFIPILQSRNLGLTSLCSTYMLSSLPIFMHLVRQSHGLDSISPLPSPPLPTNPPPALIVDHTPIAPVAVLFVLLPVPLVCLFIHRMHTLSRTHQFDFVHKMD